MTKEIVHTLSKLVVGKMTQKAYGTNIRAALTRKSLSELEIYMSAAYHCIESESKPEDIAPIVRDFLLTYPKNPGCIKEDPRFIFFAQSEANFKITTPETHFLCSFCHNIFPIESKGKTLKACISCCEQYKRESGRRSYERKVALKAKKEQEKILEDKKQAEEAEKAEANLLLSMKEELKSEKFIRWGQVMSDKNSASVELHVRPSKLSQLLLLLDDHLVFEEEEE